MIMWYGVDDVRTGGIHEPKAKARFLLIWPATGGWVVQRYIITYLTPLAAGVCFGGEHHLEGQLQGNCQVSGHIACITLVPFHVIQRPSSGDLRLGGTTSGELEPSACCGK